MGVSFILSTNGGAGGRIKNVIKNIRKNKDLKDSLLVEIC